MLDDPCVRFGVQGRAWIPPKPLTGPVMSLIRAGCDPSELSSGLQNPLEGLVAQLVHIPGTTLNPNPKP